MTQPLRPEAIPADEISVEAGPEPCQHDERAPATHELKSHRDLFRAAWRGERLHDLRRTDRAFAVGDQLVLREFDPVLSTFTGASIQAVITYVTSAGNPCALFEEALRPGFCILSFRVDALVERT